MGEQEPAADAVIKIPRGGPIHQYVLETFAATGHSPTMEQIRDRFSLRTSGEANAMVASLERVGAIHRDTGDGSITHAYPFSNEPTSHRVRLANGPEAFAMCALDALGMPFMLRKDAEIASLCAGCGVEVHVVVRGGHVTGYAPSDLMVWLAEMPECGVAATDLCPDLNFFCSSACLEGWSRAHPGKVGERLGFEDAVSRGRRVFEDLLYADDDP